jgi:hypothetical protein
MISKEINIKKLTEQLLDLSLFFIAETNNDDCLYFNEDKSEWLLKPEYEDLRFSLKKSFTSELEELGFKHKN